MPGRVHGGCGGGKAGGVGGKADDAGGCGEVGGFRQKFDSLKTEIDAVLATKLPAFRYGGQALLGDAMRYSVTAGGKRIRGVLALAVCELLGGERGAALTVACAIEYIHAYSLIHDDMPCMDDDDYRRGKPSCHKAFGEGIAMLAGDSLLNLAFELLLDYAAKSRFSDGDSRRRFIEAAAFIAAASGARGMAGGQAIDLTARNPAGEELENLRRLKTGRLFEAAVLAPAICCGADRGDYAALEEYARGLGLAFQITDDLLDITGETGETDETGGASDANGAETAAQRLDGIAAKAAASLSRFSGRADFLLDILKFIIRRTE